MTNRDFSAHIERKFVIFLAAMSVVTASILMSGTEESFADNWGKESKTKLDSMYTMYYSHKSDGGFGEGRVVIKDKKNNVKAEKILKSPYAGIDYLCKYKNKYYFQRFCNSYREGLYIFDPEAEEKQIQKIKETECEFSSLTGLDIKRIKNYTYCYSGGPVDAWPREIYIYDFDTNKLKILDDCVHAAKTYKDKIRYVKSINKDLVRVYECEPDGEKKKMIKEIKLNDIQYVDMNYRYIKITYGKIYRTKKIEYR